MLGWRRGRDACNHAICQIDRGHIDRRVGACATHRHRRPERDRQRRSELDPDYAAGKKAIEAKNWSAAIKSLSSAALRDTRNADIQNYLGYAYRNGQMDLAFQHYERALKLNPRHRGAHEYVGEAYLMVNNLAKAEEHLAALQKICLIPCEEYEDLKKKSRTTASATERDDDEIRSPVSPCSIWANSSPIAARRSRLRRGVAAVDDHGGRAVERGALRRRRLGYVRGSASRRGSSPGRWRASGDEGHGGSSIVATAASRSPPSERAPLSTSGPAHR